MPMGRSIKPGNPEFEEIAKQITPIERVSKKNYKGTYISADMTPIKYRKSSKEINKLR
jgi:hypothetical protein